MKRSLPAMLCAAALLAAPALTPALAQEGEAEEAPKNPVPQPDAVTHAWSFDFEYTTPDTIAIKNADGSVDWYWYLTYKVTNYDHDELFFDPRIVIQNDAGKIITANLGVDTRVFKEVRNLLERPLLMSPVEVPGRVFKGDDFARQSVAIWKITEKDVDSFRVFVGGIYGEVKEVKDPETGRPIMVPIIDAFSGEPKTDDAGNPLMQPLILHRTKMMHYKTPGTTETRQNPAIELVEEKDVMR